MKKLSLTLLILFAISCAPSNSPQPLGTIPKDTMISLLADVHIA